MYIIVNENRAEFDYRGRGASTFQSSHQRVQGDRSRYKARNYKAGLLFSNREGSMQMLVSRISTQFER